MPGLKSNKEFSFRHRLETEGWTKEQLMKYYAITEEQYNKTIACLEKIKPLQIKPKEAGDK